MRLTPILYQDGLARAKALGIKTQTRRLKAIGFVPEESTVTIRHGAHDILTDDGGYRTEHGTAAYFDQNMIMCPYGTIGDVLWGREAYLMPINGHPVYRADKTRQEHRARKWRPNIHMPFEVCRTFDIITDIRAERVGTITDADATAEGIITTRIHHSLIIHTLPDGTYLCNSNGTDGRGPAAAFRALWNTINNHPKYVKHADFYASFPFCEEDSRNINMHRGSILIEYVSPWVWVLETRPATPVEVAEAKYTFISSR